MIWKRQEEGGQAEDDRRKNIPDQTRWKKVKVERWLDSMEAGLKVIDIHDAEIGN